MNSTPQPADPSVNRAPLRGKWLLLARAAWIGVVFLTLQVFISALRIHHTQILQEAIRLQPTLNNLGLSSQFFAFFMLMPEIGTMLAFLAVGVLIFYRRSDDRISIFVSLTLISLGVLFTPTLDTLMMTGMIGRPALIVTALSSGLTIVFFYLFPDGRFVPRWTRYLTYFWILWWLLFCLLPLPTYRFERFLILTNLLTYTLGYGLGIFAQLYRYLWISTPVQREQTKWVLTGATAAVIASFFIFWLHRLLTPFLTTNVLNLLYGIIVSPFLHLLPPTLLLMTIGVSILRYRLWDLDLLLNRSLVYGTLTAFLGILYLLLVFVLTLIARSVFNLGNDTVVVFAATLSMAVLFNPMRRRIQRMIDRAFYRTQFDYQELLPTFSARIAKIIRLDQLNDLLTRELPQRLQIAWANLMVLTPGRDDLRAIESKTEAACTCQDAPAPSWEETGRLARDHPLIEYLQQRREPVSTAYPSADLPPAARDFLRQQNVALSIPLIIGENLIGLYNIGPKLSGGTYSRQEARLLYLLGQQAAASVENARLYHQVEEYSQNLEQQVEARTRELQQANRDLTEQHARLDTILSNMADGVMVTDREDRIVLANPAFANMIGIPAAEMIGQPLHQVWPDTALLQTIHRAISDPSKVATIDTRRGQNVYRASACALGNSDQAITGVVTDVRDITHETEVDRMKTEFISMVSHELRTPLTSVLGFAKLIGRSFERDVAPKIAATDQRGQQASQRIRDNLEIIVSEAERLTRLINDVLDISKMEAGKVEWHFSNLTLSEIIHNSVATLAAQAESKGLSLRLDVPDDLPPVRADRDRLMQVVTNLLSNAIKFTDSGGIEIRALPVQVAADGTLTPGLGRPQPGLTPGDWLAISVQDTGIGIPADKLSEVFQKFKQLGDAMTNRPKGTGLGLAICKEIVEYHGGRIWVESQPGVGSTFTFVLPLAAEKGRPGLPAGIEELRRRVEEALPAGKESKLILVVDDDENIRSLLRQELSGAGYRVLEAADGMAALAHARQDAPDLIVLDLMMPDISGFDVLRVLKGDPGTAPIPVLILSVLEDRERGLRLGADEYLIKPLDNERLLGTVANLLARAARGEGRKKVLIIDEDVSVIESISLLLQERGYEVVEAYDGQSGLEQARREHPDLIILDATISKMDNYQLLRALKSESQAQDAYVIVLTGTATPEEIAEFNGHGVQVINEPEKLPGLLTPE